MGDRESAERTCSSRFYSKQLYACKENPPYPTKNVDKAGCRFLMGEQNSHVGNKGK